jgi:hypothetical protein
MVKFFQDGYDEAKLYSKCSGKAIYPICPDCGEIKNKPVKISQIYTRKYLPCICRDGISYPEKLMYNILKYSNINFKFQYSPDWAKGKRYDFYFIINKNHYIIETDGGMHYEGNKMNGMKPKDIKQIDINKDKLAKQHNIEIIRIDCQKSELNYIKNSILNSNLKSILPVNNIDWLKCEEKSLSNLVKEVCEYQSNHIYMQKSEIAYHFGITHGTINIYLKKGDALGWCEYKYDSFDTSKYRKHRNIKEKYKHPTKKIKIKEKKLTKKQLKEKEVEENERRATEIFKRYGLD